ncbi:ACP S-malonyltransferase [Streptomyces sp. YIM 98790]|uniref:ACP S-malonyltransferase n=1 Tax=Streptomyces sp. YIM 98790 TaxID=2689077 RepID=UPI00140890E5|nr:ACP S-malonyltransferase [Streptomyces sp. YIM 98790]
MLVLVAPGQGAQSPGFLTPWLDLPGAADRLRAWSEAIDLDLVRFGTQADADEIRDTAVAQPLLVASALLSAEALLGEGFGLPGAARAAEAPGAAGRPGVVAGHSVGELAAAAIAGVLTPEEALRLVRRRGLAMAEAAAVTETGMAAVLGGKDPEGVPAHLERLGLTAANRNGAGQTVAAGTAEQLAALDADPPEGARVRRLQVAGAFHTAHMAPAVAAMETAASALVPADPRVRWVSNADGRVVDEGKEILRRLVAQVAGPVRWDLCMETFLSLGVTAMIEVCPGGTLTGLAKRGMKGVRTLALKTPEHLDAARELLAGYGRDAAAADAGAGGPAGA